MAIRAPDGANKKKLDHINKITDHEILGSLMCEKIDTQGKMENFFTFNFYI